MNVLPQSIIKQLERYIYMKVSVKNAKVINLEEFYVLMFISILTLFRQNIVTEIILHNLKMHIDNHKNKKYLLLLCFQGYRYTNIKSKFLQKINNILLKSDIMLILLKKYENF